MPTALLLRCILGCSIPSDPPSCSLSLLISLLRSVIKFTYSLMWWLTFSSFLVTLVLMFLALLAYLRVLRVSSKLLTAEEMFAIMTVLQLPPRESFSSRVNFESLYGTNCPLFDRSPKAVIQFPRASKLRLMLAPSVSLMPLFLVTAALSLPARSTRLSFPILILAMVPSALSRFSTTTCRTACDRDETALAAVACWVLFLFP
mmetsp:Transcript_24839/g.49442  ORF Transcript_24839/g.49442 Transcript_24839/m.49442 type:complete len:203 (-) Transcript_24839:454-1062(-)